MTVSRVVTWSGEILSDLSRSKRNAELQRRQQFELVCGPTTNAAALAVEHACEALIAALRTLRFSLFTPDAGLLPTHARVFSWVRDGDVWRQDGDLVRRISDTDQVFTYAEQEAFDHLVSAGWVSEALERSASKILN